MNEIWLPVVGYEGLYEVSNKGNVRRLRFKNRTTDKLLQNPIPMKQAIKFGYLRVGLRGIGGKGKIFFTHILVLNAFRGVRPDGMEAAHLNGKRDDPRLENLAWTTRKENHSHKVLHGTAQRGERNPFSKLTEAQVIEMRMRRNAGESVAAIARSIGVPYGTASSAVSGQNWKYLTEVA